MEAQIRRVIVCGSCGGHITLYHLLCPFCGNQLEPIGDARHILPHVTSNPYAAIDAESIKPHLESLERFSNYRPIEVDELYRVLEPLRDHRYPYREYIIDLLALIVHFRGLSRTCDSKERREVSLEIYKMLDAIYNSLTGNSVY